MDKASQMKDLKKKIDQFKGIEHSKVNFLLKALKILVRVSESNWNKII